MYEHVRQVITGLVLSVVVMIAAAVVANIDPWNNGVMWSNWLVISLVSVIAVITSVVIAANTHKEDDYWGWHALILVLYGIFGAIVAGVFAGSLDSGYTSLVWSAYAVPMVVLVIAALVNYIVGAVAERHGQR